MSTTSQPSKQTHHRQIRASYDSQTITVYQAYNSAIALAATSTQRLDASPLFLPTRMTWIKPSWTWTMYRSGYSYKDANQAHILALKLTHDFFWKLLRMSVINDDLDIHINTSKKDNYNTTNNNNNNTNNYNNIDDKGGASKGRKSSVQTRVQWDPERSVHANATLPPDMEGRSIRSIQIGVPREMVGEMVREGIVEIEDVTGRARMLKEYLDAQAGDGEGGEVKEDELIEKGLLPKERVYDLLPEDVAALLGITG